MNNKALIDKWLVQNKVWTGKITLTAGTRYNLRLDYYDNDTMALAKLTWKSASQPEEVIPATSLFPLRVTTDAATVNNTWTGLGINNLWSNPANWSLVQVPLATHKVIFSAASRCCR